MGSAGSARALMRLVGGPIETGMQEISTRMPHVGSRLFAAYAAASLVPVVLLGAVLVRGAQREALESGREQGRAQAAVIEEMAIAPALTGADLDHHLTATERQRLQDATDLAIFNGSVIRLRLRGLQVPMRRTFWRLAAGLAALYAVLAFIAWSTTRRLRRHATQHQSERPSTRRRMSSLSCQRPVSRPKRSPRSALMASASRRRCAGQGRRSSRRPAAARGTARTRCASARSPRARRRSPAAHAWPASWPGR